MQGACATKPAPARTAGIDLSGLAGVDVSGTGKVSVGSFGNVEQSADTEIEDVRMID